MRTRREETSVFEKKTRIHAGTNQQRKLRPSFVLEDASRADSRDAQAYGGAACASDRMSAHVYARDSRAMRSSDSLIFIATYP